MPWRGVLFLATSAAALRVSLEGHASTCTFARELAYQCVHVRKWPVALHHCSPPLLLPARLDLSATRALLHPLVVGDGESRRSEALVVVDGGGGRASVRDVARVAVVVGDDPSVARRLAAHRGTSACDVHFFRATMVAAPFCAGRTPRGDATALARRVLDALLPL